MIRSVINASIDLLWGAWQAFFGVALLIGTLDALAGLALVLSLEDLTDQVAETGTISVSEGVRAMAVGVGLFAVSLVFMSILVVMVSTAAKGRQPNAADAVRHVVERGMVLVGSIAIAAVLVFAGLLLFIVPGLWLMITLMPLIAVVLDGDEGVLDSLHSTYRLVVSQWLSVFALVLIVVAVDVGLGVMGTVGGAVGFLLSILANALSSMVLATVIWFTYSDLRRQRDWPAV